MKTTFTMINVIGGVLIFLLGLAAVLNELHSPVTALVGIVAVGLAAVCLWLASEYTSDGPSPLS